jgi:hypothetical protein
MTIIATVNLRGGSYDLLPHLSAHLVSLGVSQLLVTVNTALTPDHEGIEQVCPDGLTYHVARYALEDGERTNDVVFIFRCVRNKDVELFECR